MKKNTWLWLWLLLIHVVFFISKTVKTHGAAAVDTISVNNSLSGDQTIISKGQVFELGFFKPGKSSNYYIGMWYKNVSEATYVWVANRDQPVLDRFKSVLTISDGNLVLFNESNSSIWSTNLVNSEKSSLVGVSALLQDDGNLVLTHGSDNSSNPLWQSFEHPAHTWLPGSKIVLDKRTNISQKLISWKNKDDPAPGLFSLELDPNRSKSYIIMWNQTKKYWSSGPWNGQIFSGVPEMRVNYIYNFSFYDDVNQSYFYYTTYPNSPISRFIMDMSGQIKQLNWLTATKQWFLFWSQPRQQCDVYALCGSFGVCNENSLPYCSCMTGFEPNSQKDWDLEDFSGGCKRKTILQCGNSSIANAKVKSDKFLEQENVELPENSQTVVGGSGKECQSACLNDCSCTGYSFDNGSCSIWSADHVLNLQQYSDSNSNGKTINIRLAASELPSPKSNKTKIIGIIVGAVVGVLFLFLVAILITLKKRKTSKVEGAYCLFHRVVNESEFKDSEQHFKCLVTDSEQHFKCLTTD
ncbi:hypothetical protein ACFE04_018110 [Oxalis oulophora]